MAAPLDAWSNVTGAFSASRALLSSYSGTFKDLVGSEVVSFNNNTGLNNFVQAPGTGICPTVLATGGMGRDSLLFDGSNDRMAINASSLLTLGSTSTLYMAVSCIVLAATLNSNNSYENHLLLGDGNQWAGIYIRTGPLDYCYNWDSNDDRAVPANPGLGKFQTIEYVHSGGNLTGQVNRGTAATVSSGNTGNNGGAIYLGGVVGALQLNCRIFEVVTASSIPTDAQRAAYLADAWRWFVGPRRAPVRRLQAVNRAGAY